MGRKKTPKQVCLATRGNGDPCRRPAGWGTDHPGYGRCKFHGGRAPDGKLAAGKQEANELSTPIAVTPVTAVEGVMFSAAGELAYWHAKAAGLEEEEVLDPTTRAEHVYLRLKHKSEERLVAFAKTAADIGIDVAKVKIAERQTLLIGKLVEGVLGRLDLTADQRKRVGPAIREEMAVLTVHGEEVK